MRPLIKTQLGFMMKTITFYFLVFALAGGWLQSCKHPIPEPPINEDIIETCAPNTVYFQQQILPLFQGNCAVTGCHDAATAQDGFVFTSYSNIMASGEIIVGNLNDGDIYEVITEDDPDKIMPPPPSPALSSAQIALIAQWIQQGAQNTSCSDLACDNTDVRFSTHIEPLISAKCRGCHNNSLSNGNTNLTTYAQISSIALDGSFMGSITGSNGFVLMPYQGNALSDCEVEAVTLWIENGALND
jgi:hypothetical protein